MSTYPPHEYSIFTSASDSVVLAGVPTVPVEGPLSETVKLLVPS
mgnify:CR=1 FL=1